jgi:hypothetical protein
VAHGGHDIPEQKIRERWTGSRENLIRLPVHIVTKPFKGLVHHLLFNSHLVALLRKLRHRLAHLGVVHCLVHGSHRLAGMGDCACDGIARGHCLHGCADRADFSGCCRQLVDLLTNLLERPYQRLRVRRTTRPLDGRLDFRLTFSLRALQALYLAI